MRDAILSHLRRDFCETFRAFPGDVAVERLAATPWASITFSGARHRLRLTLEGDGAVGAAADFLGALPDHEWAIPGEIVADVALLDDCRSDDGRRAVLDLEALTVTAC